MRPAIEFRVRPDRRAGLACESHTSQFTWSDWVDKDGPLSKSLREARASERRICAKLGAKPLFEFRLKPK